MYEDDPMVDIFPHYGDKSNYFPTVVNYDDEDYGPTYIDSAGHFNCEVFFFGLDQLIIKDSILFGPARESQFWNMKRFR